MNKKIKKILIFIIFFILIIPHVKVQASTYELGDINKDGNIDEEDVITLRNIITSKEESEVGDFNSDGSIDILDIIMLRKRIVNRGWDNKIVDSQGEILNKNDNTTLVDEYGNEVIVPAGFAVTKDASRVEDGIVITDDVDENGNSTGNEFVWIPVGNVYTTIEEERTSENTKEVILGRYEFNSSTGEAKEVQTVTNVDEVISAVDKTKAISANSNYFEVTPDNATYGTAKGYTNAKAKSLEGFLKSAVINGGYYIARYEAGDATATKNGKARTSETEGTLVCKANQQVYNYIKQKDASTLSRAMYTNDNFESDLINSYAWDTAIVFIQKMKNDLSYAIVSGKSTDTTAPKTTGTSKLYAEPDREDEQCNIYDMAGNVYEWSTETCSNSIYPCVTRGGYYYDSDDFTRTRNNGSDGAYKVIGFRPLLYVGLNSDRETIE